MKIALRVDDLGWTADEIDPAPMKAPDIGLRLAQRFHAAMQGLPYLGAVIPACVDSEGAAWLRSQAKGLTVALHGWNHGCRNGVESEFHGMDLEQCRQSIYSGIKVLGETSHLVLPFNHYEPELAEACYLEGVRYIWGGGSHDQPSPATWPTPPQPYPLGRVIFVPSWRPLYTATLWRMGPDDESLEHRLLEFIDLPGKAVLTLHITWEAAKSKDFSGVRWLVNQIGDRVITVEQYIQ